MTSGDKATLSMPVGTLRRPPKDYVCVSSFAKLWGRVGKMGKSSVGKISPGFRKKEPPASLGDLPLL